MGIEGYKILIERKAVELDDFQTYRITAKNLLGKNNYNFEIIDIGKYNTKSNKKNKRTTKHKKKQSTNLYIGNRRRP